MNIEEYGSGFNEMTFKFTNTKFNQSTSISGTFIDFAGNIHGSKSQTILIMGGDDKGAYSINDHEAGSFFMTQNQRKTLMRILKGLSSFTDNATISSDNGTLQEMCVSIYNNYIG
jgi:VCBS repeat-containing protein